jgi:hypothetical protein
MKPEEPCKFIYVMSKDGKDSEFENYPTDTTYIFKEIITLNPEKCKPKITDYRIWRDTVDFTEESFKGKKLLIIIPDVMKTDKNSFIKINELIRNTQAQQIETVVFTSSIGEEYERFAKTVSLQIPYYFADTKVLKTMIRSNAGIFYMENGIVKGKWHYNDVPKDMK